MTGPLPFLVGLRLEGRVACAVGDSVDLVRRVRDLRTSGVDVRVVCDDDDVAAAIEAAGSAVLRRRWSAEDFRGCAVAVICPDPGYEGAVAAARAEGCLVYVPDVPALSDFVMAAIVRRGALQVGVSTGGRSPAAARRIAERIDASLPPATAAVLDTMAAVRSELRSSGETLPPYATWAGALDAGLEAPGEAEAEAAVRRALGRET